MSVLATLRRLPRALPVLAHRARTEPGVLAVLLVAVTVTTFVAAGLPRWLEARSDLALRDAVASAPAHASNLTARRRSILPAGDSGDPMGPVTAFGERFRDDLAPSVRSVIEEQTWVVQSDVMGFSLTQPALSDDAEPITFPRDLLLRRQQDIDDHIRIVDGRAPRPTDEIVENPLGRSFFGSSDLHIVEIALAGPALEELQVEVGQRILLTPTPGRCCPRPIFVDVVGQLEVVDPGARYWYDDRVAEPRVEPEGLTQRVTGYGVFAEGAYEGVIEALNGLPLDYTWRYRVAPERIHGGDLDRLSSDLRRLDAEFGQASAVSDVTQLQSGLLGIFDEVAAQQHATQALLALTAMGVLAIALVVIGLAGGLLAERRRPMIELLRSRGASTGQVLAAHAGEGLLAIVPGAVAAGVLAIVLIGGHTTGASVAVTAGLAAAAVAVPVLATSSNARRSLLRLRRDDVAEGVASPRRLVLEGLVVVMALVGVVLLRRRGVGGGTGLDVYLAAVPVLLGVATGLVVLRLFPMPMRALSWAAARRRDVVPFLGLRRVIRQPRVTAAPLVVLVLAVAVAVFSSVLLRTIEHRQAQAAWQEVGAGLRVDAAGAGSLHSGVDIAGVAGVADVVPAFVDVGTQAAAGGTLVTSVDLLALDGAAYAEVLEDMPGGPRLPAGVRGGAGAGAGTTDDPVPAVVSTDWMGGQAQTGDRFYLRIGGQQVHFAVHATEDRFPSVPVGRRFVVAPLAAVDAASPGRPLRPNRVYVEGDVTGASMIEALRSQEAGAVVASRADVLSDVRDSPLVAGSVWGLRVAVVLACAYAALASALALTLTARARSRDLAYLRTLGLSERQALGLTAVELGPTALTATIAGAVLGIATAHLVAPGVELSAFTGASAPAGLVVDPLTTATLAGAVLLTTAVAALAVTARTRRTDISKTLRMGDA